jgi:predicted N-formylglutamate amidohydrolase
MARNAAQRRLHVMVTCEHGGNRVPARYAAWFEGSEVVLASHRGYDPGALGLARALAARLGASLRYTTVSRLVVEQNRSPGHRQLFSEMLRAAPAAVREDAYARHYAPYHAAVEAEVAGAIAAGERVLHIASHSFTPMLQGVQRRTDIGLLYDPARSAEVALCAALQRALRMRTGLTVRLNYPYRGTSDGLPTALRRRFPSVRYAGMELEVNQRHVATQAWPALRGAIVAAFAQALAAWRATPVATAGSAALAGSAEANVSAPTRPRAGPGNTPRSQAGRPAPGLRAATRAGR